MKESFEILAILSKCSAKLMEAKNFRH